MAAIAGCEPPPLTDNGVVGSFGEMGLGPGKFSYPRGITIAPDGRVFVVDKSGHLQRFDAQGKLEVEWHMPETAAGKPVGMHAEDDGRLFVADTHYHRVIIYDFDGRELARFGEQGRGDGQFELPTDVALDAAGNIYVSEYGGNDRVTKWTPMLEFAGTVCGGEPEGPSLNRPSGIDIDKQQTLWVADACNHRIVHYDLAGKMLNEFGEMGREPGQLRYPYDIQCTAEGSILVCEFANNRLQWFDCQGHSIRVWGEHGRRLGELWAPWGVDIGKDGLIYVVDSHNDRVQIIRS